MKTFAELCAASAALPYAFPTEANRIEHLAERASEVEQHAAGVAPLLHARSAALQVCLRALCGSGSPLAHSGAACCGARMTDDRIQIVCCTTTHHGPAPLVDHKPSLVPGSSLNCGSGSGSGCDPSPPNAEPDWESPAPRLAGEAAGCGWPTGSHIRSLPIGFGANGVERAEIGTEQQKL